MRFILAALIPFFVLTEFASAQSASPISYDAKRNVLTLAPVIAKVTPGVVSISTVETEREDGSTVGGIGSGVIIDSKDGLILTNDHVIKDAKSITVILSDKRRFEAAIIGQDPDTDLALLKIPSENLTSLKTSPTDEVLVGDIVIAVGNPFGLSHSVSTGIIAAIGRTDQNPSGYSDLLQTDASINPGNSGGALVDSSGKLIGINSAIAAKESGSSGIGFAIPAHTFRAVAAQLQVYGEVKRGSLGINITAVTQEVQERLNLTNLNGAHVINVTPNGVGFIAGLQRDDVITHFRGREIKNSSDLRYAVGLLRPNTLAKLTYIRSGKPSQIEVIIREDGYKRSQN